MSISVPVDGKDSEKLDGVLSDSASQNHPEALVHSSHESSHLDIAGGFNGLPLMYSHPFHNFEGGSSAYGFYSQSPMYGDHDWTDYISGHILGSRGGQAQARAPGPGSNSYEDSSYYHNRSLDGYLPSVQYPPNSFSQSGQQYSQQSQPFFQYQGDQVSSYSFLTSQFLHQPYNHIFPGVLSAAAAAAASDPKLKSSDSKQPMTEEALAQYYRLTNAFGQMSLEESINRQSQVHSTPVLQVPQPGVTLVQPPPPDSVSGQASSGPVNGSLEPALVVQAQHPPAGVTAPPRPRSYADALSRPSARPAVLPRPRPSAPAATKPSPKPHPKVTRNNYTPASGQRGPVAPSSSSPASYPPVSTASKRPVVASARKRPHPLAIKYNLNPDSIDLHPPKARFFVIKSYTSDDVHKSIKYGVWSSTKHGNRRLDQAWKESFKEGPIYLFFSVNTSGCFCGLAQMSSALDYDRTFSAWAQGDKWSGQFSVKWIFVKNVPNKKLRHIRLENNQGKPVTNSRDTQEVYYEQGKEILEIFLNTDYSNSLLDEFSHYDQLEEQKLAEVAAAEEVKDLGPSQSERKGARPSVSSVSSSSSVPPVSGSAGLVTKPAEPGSKFRKNSSKS